MGPHPDHQPEQNFRVQQGYDKSCCSSSAVLWGLTASRLHRSGSRLHSHFIEPICLCLCIVLARVGCSLKVLGGGGGGELEILNTERWNDESCPPDLPFLSPSFVKIYSAGTHWCISIAPWCIVGCGTISKHLSAEGSQHGLNLAPTCTISLRNLQKALWSQLKPFWPTPEYLRNASQSRFRKSATSLSTALSVCCTITNGQCSLF